jgi:Fe2+ or Zn2+ uptake regulation protein
MVGIPDKKFKKGLIFIKLLESQPEQLATANALTQAARVKLASCSEPTTYKYMKELENSGFVIPVAISGCTYYKPTAEGLKAAQSVRFIKF